MGKENSNSKGKVWDNTNINISRVSYVFRVKQKFMQLPNHWNNEFSLPVKNMAKHKNSKIMDFLNISREAETHSVPKTWDE